MTTVKIVSHTPPAPIIPWWYHKHIGETFEVEEDSKHPNLFLIPKNDYYPYGRHIQKDDCKVIKEVGAQ
ncbi:hypothetical protein [Paenibacillus sp. FSL L8-0323]|uniref:hypothetical protein n=1 Tax=unclassified Paenibacillus TaxID=185978 RepID=UPI0030FB7366